jgi:hypothetical protein
MLANDTQNGSVYGVPWFGGDQQVQDGRLEPDPGDGQHL